jgi:putative phosphonate metabolism protein
MTSFPRYAIYYAPEHGGDLDRFGTELLGYDAWTGNDAAFAADIVRLVPDWPELTRDPRKYGLHATLKAPMSLAPGRSEAELLAACGTFAGKARTIPVVRPVVDAISGFIAVVPAQASAELTRLAADCVIELDSFRAPLTPEDRARRKPSALTERQRSYLDRWGYPHVMEEFGFHMTLTGRLAAERLEPVLAMLRDRFSARGPETLCIDCIALFRQDNANCRFRVLQDWALADPGSLA